MADSSYSARVVQLFDDLVERLESLEVLDDADIDLADGILNIEFMHGGVVIINRQEPLEQVWMASPLGPAHFGYDPEQAAWIDSKTGKDLAAALEEVLTAQFGTPVSLPPE